MKRKTERKAGCDLGVWCVGSLGLTPNHTLIFYYYYCCRFTYLLFSKLANRSFITCNMFCDSVVLFTTSSEANSFTNTSGFSLASFIVSLNFGRSSKGTLLYWAHQLETATFMTFSFFSAIPSTPSFLEEADINSLLLLSFT